MRYVGCLPRIWCIMLPLIVFSGSPVAWGQEDPWSAIRQDYREGQFDSAKARLLDLVARNPRDRDAHYYLGLIYWRTGQMADASTHFRQLVAVDPDGPFTRDARAWLASYRDQAITTKPSPSASRLPEATPVAQVTPSPTPEIAPDSDDTWLNNQDPVYPTPVPRPRDTPDRPDVLPTQEPLRTPEPTPTPFTPPPATPTPQPRSTGTTAPWLQAEPLDNGSRPRSARARPGYFKAADGTFEFLPPPGFILLDEGVEGREFRALFGPRLMLKDSQSSAQHPTVLLVWRQCAELDRLSPSQRVARERQLLQIEAATYGPGARNEVKFGGPALSVRQKQANWVADTWLFFRHQRLYAITYGGDEHLLERYRNGVAQSLTTFLFYP